jgi:hypothetical protein
MGSTGSSGMLEALILAVMVLAGYADWPGWTVPAGAAAATIAGWWRKVRLLRRHPQVPFSAKMTGYLIASIVFNVIFSAASYVAGQVARWWLGE